MLNNKECTSYDPKTSFARELRVRQTSGEKSLWGKLRAKRFHDLKFRRQVPIGPFIVDFLCIEKKLIIEVDGWTHGELGAKEYDNMRENYLKKQGFVVFRISNSLAKDDTSIAIEKLRCVLGYPTE